MHWYSHTPKLPTSHARRRTVAILNPARSGKQYTSANNAKRMVQRGIAVWIAAHVIRLVAGSPQFTHEPDWQDRQTDAAIEHNRGGVVWWNGCRDPKGLHLPGHNVAYPRPDRGVG